MMNLGKPELISYLKTQLIGPILCRSDGFPSIVVKGMNFSQSIEAPLTLNDTAFLSGNHF